LLASHNNPAASAVATDTDVIAVVDFPWVPAVVMVFSVAGPPAAVVVLTAVDVLGAPVVAKVSAVVAVTIAVDVLPDTVVSNVCSAPALVGIPAVGVP
jgi:hypothetical protein